MSPKIISYSPAYTLVPTYECFNRCDYCNFRVDPQQDSWLTLAEAQRRLTGLYEKGIREILILSGEVHPNSQRRAYLMTLLKELALLALEMGFIPHTNAGPLSWEEMAELASVNGSMGLMLEQMTKKLPVHRFAPSKDPQLRYQQLEWAGQLRIPFTTGLLLGIGETLKDWEETLQAIARVHERWEHIQEVILQPYSPGTQQQYQGDGFDLKQLPQVIRLAKDILPEAIAIQIPPNLVADPQWLLACLKAGAKDLGGIVPKDEVNPDYKHLQLKELKSILAKSGWSLHPRLAVYPQYDQWLSREVQKVVRKNRDLIAANNERTTTN